MLAARRMMIDRARRRTGGPWSDNFNRANASTLGTASDGGVWVNGSNGAIASNQAQITLSGIGANPVRDVGNLSPTVQVTMRQGAFGAAVRVVYILFNYDPTSTIGYAIECSASGAFALRRTLTLTRVGNFTTGTSWSANGGATPGGPTTIVVTWNATTHTATVTQGGVSRGSVTDTSPITPVSTYVGLADNTGFASSQITFDDISAS